MFAVIKDTKGVPGSCALEYDSGMCMRCRASHDMCKIDGGECPFDKHNVIQLEYRKTIDE